MYLKLTKRLTVNERGALLVFMMQLIFDGLPDAVPLERVAQQDDQGNTAGRGVLSLEQLPANQDQQQNVQAGKDGVEF